MEISGYWEKIPGARPYYVRRAQRVDTRRVRVLDYAYQNTMPLWRTACIFGTPVLQSHNDHVVDHVISMKRPSSAKNLSAGAKRMCSRTEPARIPAPILPLNRKEHLDNISKRIDLKKEDKVASKSLVDHTLKLFINRAFRLEGGRMYRREYSDAGSYPVKLKIGKADEFDVNIPLNIDVKSVCTNGKVHYCFDNTNKPRYGVSNLNVEKKLFYDSDGTAIPPGYAVIDVEEENFSSRNLPLFSQRNKLPRKFVHTNLQKPHQISVFQNRFRSIHQAILAFSCETTSSNRSSTKPGCIELIPVDVKKDLFEKMKVAQCLIRNQNASICKVSHGPALKMTIRPGVGLWHDINVDITVSVQCDIPLSTFGWPRKATKLAFDMGRINEALRAGIHLVPKKDLFWAISFSKAEKALLYRVDADQGCRKYVVKIMKKYVMTCSSQSANGLPGISSHIIKTQILWSCEAHCNCWNYWCWENRDVCLINTLEELEVALTSRRLPDYFYPALNILEGKDTDVLTRLASFLNARRKELLNMI